MQALNFVVNSSRVKQYATPTVNLLSVYVFPLETAETWRRLGQMLLGHPPNHALHFLYLGTDFGKMLQNLGREGIFPSEM